jgi:mRNA interferase MazF
MSAAPPEPKRGEVWRVEFDPSRGAEIRKTRPAVVVSVGTAGRLALRVIVPLTEWQTPFARAFWMVQIAPSAANGLTKDSAADGFQVRSFSVERFVEKIGELEPVQMDAIARAVAVVVGAPNTA